jgi:dTDP-4-dehydrorhamnose reductase
MHILVTGSKGQLGSEIREIAPEFPQYDFIFTDVDELDITDKDAVMRFFETHEIQSVINCAAYTNVDKAEDEEELARSINMMGARNIARACNKYKAGLFHISTDYVFDGNNYRPYRETDYTNPKSVYGETKLEGEEMVEEFADTAVIIRTSWLFSSYGNNFVKTILKYAAERDELRVVVDQIGTPTYAADLARLIVNNLEDMQWLKGTHYFHYSNEGVCSWYDFAKEIVELSGNDCKVTPIESKDYPQKAARPFYSVLNKAKIKDSVEDCKIPHWKDALKRCLQKLNA